MLRNLMCSVASALLILSGSADGLFGQTIAVESFDSPAGSSIDGLIGAGSFGFDGGFTGVNANLIVQTVSGGIAPGGSPIESIGGHLGIADSPDGAGSGDRFSRALDTSAFASFGFLDADGNISGADGSSLYVGFALQTLGGEATANANSALEFNLDGGNNQFSFGNDGGDLGVGGTNDFGFDVNAASPDFGVTAGDAVAVAVNLDVANTFVIRIDYDSSGDTATVFANPTDAVEGNQTPVGSTATPGVSLAFDEIGYFNFSNSPGVLLDELRISASFEGALITAGVPLLDGDVDGDGNIDLDDFDILVANFFNTGAPGSVTGEAVSAIDGVVDINDFIAFRTAFEAVGGGSLPAFTLVPEPSAAMLLGSVLLGGCATRRRRITGCAA